MGIFARIAGSAGWNSGRSTRDALAAADANFQLLEPSVKTSAAANYQPVLGDKVIRRSNAAAQTTTIPTNAVAAFPVGHEIKIEQTGAGAHTLVAANGVTINKVATKGLGTTGQFAIVRLIKMDTNVWSASGDLGAP